MSTPVSLIGRIVADPELRFGPSGTAFASFSVVTSKRVKGDAGTWEDKDTSFHNCKAFGPFAENIAESCLKGTGVVVTGDLKQEEYTTKEGEKRKVWVVMVNDLGVSCRWKTVTVSEGAGSKPKPSSYDENPPF